MTVPVVIVSSVDPVLRDLTSFVAISDLPGTGVLRQDLDPPSGTLRRVVSDASGIVEDRTAALEHLCLGCAIREDSLPALGAMAASGRWERIVWALPVGAATPPAARPLADPSITQALGVDLAAVVSLVDNDAAQADLLGDDLLDDRGLALALDDRRSVGEALSGQVRHADMVLTVGHGPIGSALVDQLRGIDSRRMDLLEIATGVLSHRRHSHRRAEARIDPRLPGPPDSISAAGVRSWTLQTHRPLHPDRFLEHLGQLVAGNLLSHGCFHLASRPDQVGEWDGAGGQLSLGDGGAWGRIPPRTRLRFVGTGDPRPHGLHLAFQAMLLTDEEWARPNRWLGADDGLDPWLGERQSAA